MENKEAWTNNLEKKILDTEKKDVKQETSKVSFEVNERCANAIKKKIWSRVGIVAVALILLIGVMVLTQKDNNIISVNNNIIPEEKQSMSIGNLVKVSTFTDKLEYYPKNISTELNGYIADLNIDVTDTLVQGYGSLPGYSYLGYLNIDGTIYTEIIISRDIPEEVNIADTIKEWLKNPDQANQIIGDATQDEELNKLIQISSVNLYNIGYLFVIQQTDIGSESMIYTQDMAEAIMDTMLYDKITEDTKPKTFLEFDSFGTYNLYDMEDYKDIGIYADNTGEFRVYDNVESKDIFMLTYINNPYSGEDVKDINLVQREGWNNLYDTKESTHEYNGFGVQTVRGMYFIQPYTSEISEQLINLLGIQTDDSYISPIFKTEDAESMKDLGEDGSVEDGD